MKDIPRIIHIVWVGDESLCPRGLIETWRTKNPLWQVRVWGNDLFNSSSWINRRHMDRLFPDRITGVADLMRWEILLNYGGFAVDADSVCLRPLEDWLFEVDAFACWENEILRPGLISNGYVYARAGDALISKIVEDLSCIPQLPDDLPWKVTGPLRLTQTYRDLQYSKLTIYPSHFFIPTHFAGARYNGGGTVFATQLWGSTRGRYIGLSKFDPDKYLKERLQNSPIATSD